MQPILRPLHRSGTDRPREQEKNIKILHHANEPAIKDKTTTKAQDTPMETNSAEEKDMASRTVVAAKSICAIIQ